eukprot:scaffold208513_cov40-Prasinocladus_malaysianus.AAC.1
MPGPICAMEDLMAALGGAEGAAWEYEWMPPATTAALVHLLSAQILQPANKVKHALAHLHKARGRGKACFVQSFERNLLIFWPMRSTWTTSKSIFELIVCCMEGQHTNG